MKLFDLYENLHFIGACGVSMSALIKLSLSQGASVSGSDLTSNMELEKLNRLGARVYVGSRPEIVKGADLVVYSLAVPFSDPELSAATELGLPVMSRAEFLAALSAEFEKTVAVAGTHGKTTATALIAAALKAADAPFAAHIGGNVKQLDGNFVYKGDKLFLTEACEYKQSLLKLYPDVGVILNVESDHPDCYKDLSELYDTFNRFALNTLADGGTLVINGDCKYFEYYRQCSHMQNIAYDNTITFGLADTNACYPVNITENKGKYSFDVCMNNCICAHIDSPIYGHHSIFNLIAAFAACVHIGIDKSVVAAALSSFEGVGRRFEQLPSINGARIFLDYAHHPSEIAAAIETAKKLDGAKKLVVYFQPHTFSRTAKYFDDFVSCLLAADDLRLIKTYPARELPENGKTAEDLYFAIKKKKPCKYFDSIKQAEESLFLVNPKQTVLILGAGDFLPNIPK